MKAAMYVCALGEVGAGPVALAAWSLLYTVSSHPITQPPLLGYRQHHVQTTANLLLNIQCHFIAPPGALTFPPHLAPRVCPKWEKTKVNPGPCSSSKRRSLSPGSPFHRSQQAGEWTPLCLDSKAPDSNNRENMQAGGAGAEACGRWGRRAGHCLRSPGVWSSRGCTRELLGSRGRPLIG